MNDPDLHTGRDHLQNHIKIKNQVKILYSQSIVTFIFPVLAALNLTVVLWDVADHDILSAWLGTVIILSVSRYYLLWKYNQTIITSDNINKWLEIFTALAFISGIIWGTAGIILIPYDNTAIFTLYNGFTILTICGLVAGAVISYSVNFSVFLSYSFPSLILPAFYLISLGDNHNSAFGGLILLYYFFIATASYRMRTQFMFYFDMEYQQSKLKLQYDEISSLYADLRRRTNK